MFGEKTNLDRAGRKDPTSSHKKSLSGSMSKVSCLNFGIHSRNRYQGLLLKYTEIQGHLSYLLFGHKLWKLLLIKSMFLISKTSLVLSYREELRESFPRQVDKKSRGPQGERGLEFSRKKKGQTFFPSTFLRII